MAARRPAHKVAHKDCPNGVTSWDACDEATRRAKGPCSAMTEKEEPCTNWAIDTFAGKGYCGQHFASRVNAEQARIREAARRAEVEGRIEAFLAWTREHPSVHDQMPKGWVPGEGGAAYTGTPAAARTPDVSSAAPRKTTRVLWSASSGARAPG